MSSIQTILFHSKEAKHKIFYQVEKRCWSKRAQLMMLTSTHTASISNGDFNSYLKLIVR